MISGNKITDNPTAAKILPLFFPTPTNSSTNIDATGNNLITTENGKYSEDGYDGRIDYVFNSAIASFSVSRRKALRPPVRIASGAIGALGTSSDNELQSPAWGRSPQPPWTPPIWLSPIIGSFARTY